MQPVIAVVDDVTFQYRRATQPALRNVSFELCEGEVLLVAGPSGCGKSTLMRILNGLIPHAYRGAGTGSVRLAGRSTSTLDLRELSLLVATVLQDPERQIVASTVEAELAFGPENLGLAREEIGRRIARAADETEILPFLDRTTEQLSGGERQRVAVAGALTMAPRILVLDEPLANLDPAGTHRLLAQLRRLADQGTAIVIVEHRVEDVLALRPDRILYLEEGAIRYLGAVDGFLAVADPRSVKLPFEVTLARMQSGRLEPRGSAADAVHSIGAEQSEPRLEYERVTTGYDGDPVLSDLSARFGAREIVAVLGPNGSGKTTLFKLALNLMQPWNGVVRVDGESIARRRIVELATIFGYVFQNPAHTLFEPTVRDELLFAPRNLGRSDEASDEMAVAALRRARLDDPESTLDRSPLSLSFGQQKRLAIAIALALGPRTLILDEPTAGQDYRSSTGFLSEVRQIGDLESVYLVTHDADLALVHADRVLLLRDGRVAAEGAPIEVIADRKLWTSCNLRYTSLMEANLRWKSMRFLSAEALARTIVAEAPRRAGAETAAERKRRPEETEGMDP
jgi:energy-coupling factor transport system ATP-binding protein